MNRGMNSRKIIISILIIAAICSGIYLEYRFRLFDKLHRAGYKAARIAAVFQAKSRQGVKDTLRRRSASVISDFESQDDLALWEKASVRFERSRDFARQGSYSLKITYPKGDYPGLQGLYRQSPLDWRAYQSLKMDVYNPDESVDFYVMIKGKDNATYALRHDRKYTLNPGWNHVTVDLTNLRTNDGSGTIARDTIIQYVFALGKTARDTVLYLDNVILQTAAEAKRLLGDPEFVVNAARDVRPISPLIFGTNLKPEITDMIDARDFAKETGITIFRYPGGDAPGYHWKTGTFDFRTDKPYLFPFTKYETVVNYCRAIGAQLVIQVNLESGTPQEAAEWVRHTNKELGFYVKYWELGNEPYGSWDASHRTADQYARDLKEYSEAMKAVDPTIKLGAAWAGDYFKDWDKIVLSKAGDYIDFFARHWYPNHTNTRKLYNGKAHPDPMDVAANAFKVPEITRRMESMIRKYAPHREGKIEYGVLEWDGAWDAPSYNPEPYAQGIVQWSLANGLFFAETFGQFIKEGVVLGTSYTFQETPFGYIRGHLTEDQAWNVFWDGETIRPKALAHKMFSKYFGTVLVEGELKNSPVYVKPPDWYDASYTGDVPYLTAYAGRSDDGDKLYLMFINRHPDQNLSVKTRIEHFDFDADVVMRVLTGPSITAQNDGSPGTVDIFTKTITVNDTAFIFECPKHSVVSLEFRLADIEKIEDRREKREYRK